MLKYEWDLPGLGFTCLPDELNGSVQGEGAEVQVTSRTFLEAIGRQSTFPSVLRDAIVQSVEMVTPTEFHEASSRREGEEGNLDHLIA